MITYIVGDATLPQGDGPKIIAHICNDAGLWGKGFVLALSKRWPVTRQDYLSWYRNRGYNSFGLGGVLYSQVEKDISVAHMIGQQGIRTSNNPHPIRYDALSYCLQKVSTCAVIGKASVHVPRIGCGQAGGKWELVEPFIIDKLCHDGIKVFVYDLP